MAFPANGCGGGDALPGHQVCDRSGGVWTPCVVLANVGQTRARIRMAGYVTVNHAEYRLGCRFGLTGEISREIAVVACPGRAPGYRWWKNPGAGAKLLVPVPDLG